MFTNITRINVTFSRSKYIPELRDEKGKIVPGTGTTEQIEVAKFKRNKLAIPDEVKEKLSSIEFEVLTEALRKANDAENRQKYANIFDTFLLQLGELVENEEYLEVTNEQLERYVSLSSLLKRKVKGKLKRRAKELRPDPDQKSESGAER